MHQLPPASLLVVHLEAGLSALKMPASAEVVSAAQHAASCAAPHAIAVGTDGRMHVQHTRTQAHVYAHARTHACTHAPLTARCVPRCRPQPSSREDPLHLPSFQALAEPLPCAKHVRSKLLCSVTRSIMSDANPPVVLPNGCGTHARARGHELHCSTGPLCQLPAPPPCPSAPPCRYVYSQAAIDMIAQEHGGRVVCPVTGATYSQDELRRAFIV